MAQNKDFVLDTVTRRVASIASHLVSSHLAPSPYDYNELQLGLCNTSSSSSRSDSYQRVHGDVPSHDAVWSLASDVDSGKDFTDIVYEKAVGEAIAKVSVPASLLWFQLFEPFFFFWF